MKSQPKHFSWKYLLGLAIIIIASVLPLAITNSYSQSLFIQVLINIIVVVGLNFITGLTGQMNLGTAGIFALGAYTSAILNNKFSLNPWIGMVGAIIMGLLIGMGLGYPSLRVKGVYLSLTTIGFSEIVRILITNLTDLTGGVQGIPNLQFYSIFGFEFNNNIRVYYLYLALTVLLVFVAHRIVNSKWGRAFKSIKDNPEASESLGINISNLKIQAFTLAALYGCVAGALHAHYMSYINPVGFTMDFSINYVVMLMIGGIGSVPGNILGAFLITMGPEWLRFMQDYYWLVFSIITLLFAVFLPNGIISILRKKTFKKKSIHSKGGKQDVDSSET